jgi:hypothetical protein
VKHGIDVEFSLILPQIVKRDSLGVAYQPGGFVVEGSSPFLQGAYAEGDWHRAALAPEATAGWDIFTGHAAFALRESAHGLHTEEGKPALN